MAGENTRIVREVIDAWNIEDVDSIRHLISDDIVWLEVGGMLEAEGTERQGWDEVGKGMESLADAFRSYEIELEEMFEVEDRVVAILREKARGRTSGAEVDTRFGYVITVSDGKLSRIEAYRDPDEALVAAGVAGQSG
jgi:ketosteroid isomerase-like protein